MRTPEPLPPALTGAFSIAQARHFGVERSRLRHRGLGTPFRGVRKVPDAAAATTTDPYALLRAAHVAGARDYRPRLRGTQFFSHHTAAALWGGPLPWTLDEGVHVSIIGAEPLPRIMGVTAHRARTATTRVVTLEGMPVSSPASTWASLGMLPLPDLVALGDFFCRVWRPGVGRPSVNTPPLTTIAQLRVTVDAGRRVGNPRLRAALELIREDAWSPRETHVRLALLDAGLPEPMLNIDVFDDRGRFLGCADMAYPERKVAVEYHGRLHADSYARDVERMAALRAAGWTVIEVTSELLRTPHVLVARVRAALRP